MTSSSINELPSAETLTAQLLSDNTPAPVESIDELPSAGETLTAQRPSDNAPVPVESIDELPSAGETLTAQLPSDSTPAPVEPMPSSDSHPTDDVTMESSSIDELPSAAETLTFQNPSDITPAPPDSIPSVDPNPTDDVEAIGEKRKRSEKTNLESSDPNFTPSPWWKTSLCSYFRRESSCSHGSTCKYAHGEEELRMKPDNTWDPTSQRGKKARISENAGKFAEEEEDGDVLFTEEMMDDNDGEGCGNNVHDLSLSKCLVHLPKKWLSGDLKKFVQGQV